MTFRRQNVFLSGKKLFRLIKFLRKSGRGTCIVFSDNMSPCRGIKVYLNLLSDVASNNKGMIDNSCGISI